MNNITENLLDNHSRNAFRRAYLPNKEALNEWERALSQALHTQCQYPAEQFAWDLFELPGGGFYLALNDAEGIEDLEVIIAGGDGLNSQWLSTQGACLLANLLLLRSVGNAYEQAWNFEMAKPVQEDEGRLRQFVEGHPACREILACFDRLASLTLKERNALVDRAMDVYLYDNDLGGASPLAGDEIVSVMFTRIGEVIEEGELRDVDAIVEEAWARAAEEIDEILEQDRFEQWERADDDEEEVCDA